MNEQVFNEIVGLWVLLVLAIGAMVSYIIWSAILWRIGKKFLDEDFLAYCIPVYQLVLMCRCAQVSGWHAAAACVPIVNCGACIWIFGNIARRLGRNFWVYGVGSLLTVPVLVLAFSKDKPVAIDPPRPVEPPDAPVTRRFLLSCVKGEIVGSRITVSSSSLVIGRNPQQAQIVLSHPHVSSSHVRIWMETGGARIWMEDMGSRNGTSFRRATEHGWTAVKGPEVPLDEGDMIRIADGIAEFRVIEE